MWIQKETDQDLSCFTNKVNKDKLKSRQRRHKLMGVGRGRETRGKRSSKTHNRPQTVKRTRLVATAHPTIVPLVRRKLSGWRNRLGLITISRGGLRIKYKTDKHVRKGENRGACAKSSALEKLFSELSEEISTATSGAASDNCGGIVRSG